MNPLTADYSEDQLFLLMQEGSEAAFGVLYKRYLDPLFSRALYLLHDAGEAEDVTQEVFVSFWNRRAVIEIRTTVKAYLFGAVQLQCADRLRKKASRHNRQQVYASFSSTITASSPLENKELGSQLDAAIALVSPAYRRAFLLLYIERKSLKEIAAVMNIRVQTAKNHVQQALKTLRQHLRKI